jgi:hypothetical protein
MVGTQTNTTLIGRLRIRSKSADPQAEQQRIARMLRGATLHPSGLPESATLIVRRLADPLPSRLRTGPLELLPDASWQRAVTAALERLAASAARPAYGAVPAESEAVLFYDRAEVLASLALDWMSGTLAVQWWWREFLRERHAVTGLLREWMEAPQYVPNAVDLLAKRTRAVQFMQRVPEQAATNILEAVLAVHSVPRPTVWDVPQTNAENAHRSAKQVTSAPQRQTNRYSITSTDPSLPWVPEASAPGLLPVQRALLIQTLMLRREPTVARTVAFQKELLRWHTRYESADIDRGRNARKTERELLNGNTRETLVASEALDEIVVIQEAVSDAPLSRLSGASEQDSVEASSVKGLKEMEHKDLGQLHRHGVVSGQQSTVPEREEATRSPENSQSQSAYDQAMIVMAELGSAPPPSPDDVQDDKTAEPSKTFDTEYGGVFLLLGLALYLYIYGDFTCPLNPGLELNIWDFLALMATELTEGKIERDPLWDELASLAGRDKSVRPGLGFEPPDEWRLPTEWLAPFAEDYDSNPGLINGRIVTMHPAGFAVLDISDGTEQAGDPVDRLQRWIGWMTSYFRARLVRALGRADAVALLCNRPARVMLTLTHVNVIFSLDHHPIELRIAGLDRDLGWIPAAGRYVAFHFQ